MYSHQPKSYLCPLCQIAKGEPTEKGSQEQDVIFRNKELTIFIAGKQWKNNLGHVIIIPNKHIENIYIMPEKIGHKIFDYSKKVALALKKAYKCDGVSARQHNEPAGNQDVWHYHQHIFPRYKGDNLYLNHQKSYWPSAKEKKRYADKLRRYFKK